MATEVTFDFEAYYRADGYGGIAWYAVGYDKATTEERWLYIGGNGDDREDESNYLYFEPEEYDDTTRVQAIMVGDDRVFTFDVAELTLLPRKDFCGECGQIGCGHDGYDR